MVLAILFDTTDPIFSFLMPCAATFFVSAIGSYPLPAGFLAPAVFLGFTTVLWTGTFTDWAAACCLAAGFDFAAAFGAAALAAFLATAFLAALCFGAGTGAADSGCISRSRSTVSIRARSR